MNIRIVHTKEEDCRIGFTKEAIIFFERGGHEFPKASWQYFCAHLFDDQNFMTPVLTMLKKHVSRFGGFFIEYIEKRKSVKFVATHQFLDYFL